MDLPAQRVKKLDCPSCGEGLDPKAHRPLSTATCPFCGADVPIPAQFDTFRLIRFLGSGGTGFVMEAFDERLHRRVAIKVLRAGGDADKVAMEATQEARSLAKLNHRAVVHVFSLGEHAGHKYIVMELLNGGSAKRFTTPDDRLDERGTLDLAIDIAGGLDAARKVGLVHMDVKPGNILYADDGNARLIDFGAAQHAKMRKTQGAVGTPYYIAPEVARGKTPDFKSDIYSLGATLFHLITGDPPFDGTDTNQVILARLKRPAPSARKRRADIHPATDAVITRMMAKDPDERYDSYDDLLTDLRAAREALDDPTGMMGAELSATVAQPRALRLRQKKGRIPGWVPPVTVATLMIVFGLVLFISLGSGGDGAADPNDAVIPADNANGPDNGGAPDVPVRGAGRVVQEIWRSVPGGSVDQLNSSDVLDRVPDAVDYATTVGLMVSAGDQYARRLRGYIVPPTDGEYRFTLSADDSAAMYVSGDDQPVGARRVAQTTQALRPGEYTEPGDAVTLEAGKRYYFEVVHKQDGGGDHVVAGWVLPDGTREQPIRSSRLVPPQTGLLTYERWNDLAGETIEDARAAVASKRPDAMGLATFAAAGAVADGDGSPTVQRLRGVLRVQVAGDYTFKLLADDAAGVWLGEDASPDSARPVVTVNAATSPDAWDKAAASQPVRLEAETPYYFEVVQRHATGAGFVRVGLQHPDGFVEQPMPAKQIAPFE